MPRANQTNKTEENKATEEVKDPVKAPETTETGKETEKAEETKKDEAVKVDETKADADNKNADAYKVDESDKDKKIAELQEQLKNSEHEKAVLANVVNDQHKELKELRSGNVTTVDSGSSHNPGVAVASNDAPKLFKVKFLKDHSFTFGHTDIKALSGQIKEVDLHTMNKLAGRGIAVSIG